MLVNSRLKKPGWKNYFNRHFLKEYTLVSTIQDEVHRYSISFSRARHQKSSFELSLTKCEGIGQKRAAEIFRHFKTIKAIRAADVDALAAVKGVSRPAAEKLYEFLHADD